MTNSPHVPFFRPLIALLEERGHEVHGLRTRLRADARAARRSRHRARRRRAAARRRRAGRQVRAMGSRLRALRAWAGPQRFDLALSHASHELPLAARSLGVPSAYAYDYEFARAQHTLGSRAATRVVVPDAIPQERLDRLGADGHQGAPLPGAEGGVLPRRARARRGGARPARARPGSGARRRPHAARGLALPPSRQPAVRRRARAARHDAARAGGRAAAHARAARRRCCGAALPSLVVPEHAIDAQSLIALADLVVSAGGTMNREAVALGTPVWTTFAGTMGAVDEGLIADGRLAELRTPTRSCSRRRRRQAPAGGRRDPELHARPAALGARQPGRPAEAGISGAAAAFSSSVPERLPRRRGSRPAAARARCGSSAPTSSSVSPSSTRRSSIASSSSSQAASTGGREIRSIFGCGLGVTTRPRRRAPRAASRRAPGR